MANGTKIYNRDIALKGDAQFTVGTSAIIGKGTGDTVWKAGTSTSPIPMTTATNFFQQYVTTTATSGDTRAIYNRLYLSGIGGSGESLRTFTTVNNVAAATAHGAHTSLSFGTSGSITGLGVAGRNTLQLPNATMTGGTYSAVQAELYADGASTSATGVTELSFIRAVLDGNATGLANAEDKANLITVTGGTNASGNVVGAAGNEPTWTSKTHLIRCNFNGTVVYLVGVQL